MLVVGRRRRGPTENEVVGWHHQLKDMSWREIVRTRRLGVLQFMG